MRELSARLRARELLAIASSQLVVRTTESLLVFAELFIDAHDTGRPRRKH
jgi:hypothetical protein